MESFKAIVDFQPRRLERVGGVITAISLAGAILPDPQPDPEFDEQMNQVLAKLGLPLMPVEVAVAREGGRLYELFNNGPIRYARITLGVVAPATLCFSLLSRERKRAIVSPQLWRYLLADLAPKAVKGYVSILLPQLAAAAFNHFLLPRALGPDPLKAGRSVRDILLYGTLGSVATLFLHYWRPGNHALVRGMPSGVLGLRFFSGFSRQLHPRFWMFFDIAAGGPFFKLAWCLLFGPRNWLPRFVFQCAQAFVTAGAATRLERALRG
ncbi:hypothetical protein PG985_000832 [Apiospora marii]|uniref:uncharacterized protein n=1 Tax=Apiospora marii TaxID=335849 RepID=UPI003131B6C1